MIFFRRQVPLLITLITGIVFAAQYYVPHPASEQMLTSVTKWLQIIEIGRASCRERVYVLV